MFSTYYVSALSGLNAGPGTLSRPFRTIQEAANVAKAGDTVLIRTGTYRETVTPARSGKAGAPITFAPYNGEMAIVSGADVVRGGWAPYSNAGNHPIFISTMPWDLGDGMNQVFFDTRMMNEARWPNTKVGTLSNPTLAVTGSGSSTAMTGPAVGTITDSHLTQPAGYWVGATIHIGNGQGWVAQTSTVTSYTPGTITYSFPAHSSYETPIKGDKYYLFGKLQELDAPGEWFRDSGGTLYFWAPTGSNPSAGHSVEVKRRAYAFDLSGKSFIDISGLRIVNAAVTSDAASGNLHLDHVRGKYMAHFTDNPIGWGEFPDQAGIFLAGDGNQLTNSTIAFTAGHGLYLQGSNDLADNNVIHDVDYNASNGGGINVEGANDVVTNNTLFNLARSGIRISHTTAGKVMHNLVYNGALQTSDTGGIYAYGTDGGGTEVAYNVVHDYKAGGFGGDGLFLDNGCSHYILHHNLVYNCTFATHFNDPSDNNLVYNNTLAGPNSLDSNGTREMIGSVFMNNIFTGIALSRIGPQATVSHNSTTSTPGFVSTTGSKPADFMLQSTSPAIDAGAVLTPYTDGFQGSAPDEGAFEFGAAPWTAGAS